MFFFLLLLLLSIKRSLNILFKYSSLCGHFHWSKHVCSLHSLTNAPLRSVLMSTSELPCVIRVTYTYAWNTAGQCLKSLCSRNDDVGVNWDLDCAITLVIYNTQPIPLPLNKAYLLHYHNKFFTIPDGSKMLHGFHQISVHHALTQTTYMDHPGGWGLVRVFKPVL